VTAVSHSWYVSVRGLRALARQPWWLAISLVQPLVYLLLYSALFERVVEIPGFEASSYLDYVVPGIVLMTALFSGGWAGMGVIDDLQRGVMDRFLVSPVKRSALIAGRLVQQAVITVIQSLIVIGLGLATGATLPGGAAGVGILIASAIVLGTAFGALSIGLALVVRREESVVAAVQLLLLPLTFLSSMFMQHELMPGWIGDVAAVNPADWAVQVGRGALAPDVAWSDVLTHGTYLVLFALACAWLATCAFRAYQQSV
jgi:ABC-2 type transport system permease protein